MKVGDRVVLVEDFEFNNKVYKKGHQFNIIGDDDMRGFDLKDDDGNEIGETRFIRNIYVSLSDFREDKINKII
jgi:hypothetical protein